jgi:hypothetical protein
MSEMQQSKSEPKFEIPQELPPSPGFDVQRSMPVLRSLGEGGFYVPRISAFLSWFKNFFDYLGASREEPPPGAPFLASSWWLGLWWGLLIGLILLFCGQTSKFIYIDF